jgi:hypothetical protein
MTLHHLKFSRCAVGKHQGEYWSKLAGIPDGSEFRLLKVEYRWAHDLTDAQIQRDTFADMTRAEFEAEMERFYGMKDVFGLWLTFRQMLTIFMGNDQVRTITTFRGYEPEKQKYYEGAWKNGDIFQLKRM